MVDNVNEVNLLLLEFLFNFYNNASSSFAPVAALVHFVLKHVCYLILGDSKKSQQQRQSYIKHHWEPSDCFEAIHLVDDEIAFISFEVVIFHRGEPEEDDVSEITKDFTAQINSEPNQMSSQLFFQ